MSENGRAVAVYHTTVRTAATCNSLGCAVLCCISPRLLHCALSKLGMEAGLNHAYVTQRGLPVGVSFTPSPRLVHRTLCRGVCSSEPQSRIRSTHHALFLR
eukprot:COSAG02_NODE_17715_length_985_cov_1.759594_1_plen_100_part_01